MTDDSFNPEREVEQLRLALEDHLEQLEEIEEYIERLQEARRPGIGETEQSYKLVKLSQKYDYHFERVFEIRERILELKKEQEKEDTVEKRLSLVTGKTGAGTTTYGVKLADEDDNPIISNLESLEDAYYANSWRDVESILDEHPDRQFTILIDEYAGCVDDAYEFVTQMSKRGHHTVIVNGGRDEFHNWLKEVADDEYHLKDGRVVINTTTGFSNMYFRPSSRSFDSQEIPQFDFSKPPKAYPWAEKEDEDDVSTSFAEFFGLTEEEARAATQAAEDFASGKLPDDLFEPEEEFPPQVHLDNLETRLDYNLGQVDGFCDLDWQSKCDLARVAVDNDLTIEELETILDLSQGGEAREDL